ncbi:MAG: hypothetical protein IJ311_02255 [Elusimicrobiaceae bacterium]|nr:hypothetical protein [Elusimicrobiaceae bacterium]
MIKILLKAAVLLLIVLSVYFIVHPSACSNLLAGRETGGPSVAKDSASFSEENQVIVPSDSNTAENGSPEVEGIIDTNTLTEEENQIVYSQEDIDYAIASRYVELEREYARTQPMGKDSSREIAFVVMDDFEMSPAEWESFIARATASDLFNKVRRKMPLSSAPATVPEPTAETVSVQ